MAAVSIFSSVFCNAGEVAASIAESTGYRLVEDMEVVSEAGRLSGIPAERIGRCFRFREDMFNPFTHELESTVSWLKLALAQTLEKDRFLLHGFSAHLLPHSLAHVLRVLVIADIKSRLGLAADTRGLLNEAKARKRIREEDQKRQLWVNFLREVPYPWEPGLYDMVLPADKTSAEEAADLVARAVRSEQLARENPDQRWADFLAGAGIEVNLAKQGYCAGVEVNGRHVWVTIPRPVVMWERLAGEIEDVVMNTKGLKPDKVEIKAGGNHRSPFSYQRFEPSARVLLVDDEREFVRTLSERLGLREIDSQIAYDGESAMDMVHEDPPEVMVLDLQMPGIDGIEVLRRVKAEKPEIEVVILTGHGTDADRDVCMELGAFAYLEKPVDIDTLSETLKRAEEHMRSRKSGL
jgi:two-component system, OmpR family, response regulator CpxR